jgi:tetratricopeptide (TPR) repeat protein
MALHIVRADAGVARAKVLNQIKNHDPKTVELYQVKDALGVKGGKPDDPSIPHTIEFAIGILEGFYKNNPDNLQVAIKLAQDYEAEGYALLNRVASLQNRVEAAKYFKSAEDIYNYKADGEHFSIPEQVRCLGLARVHKIQGSMNGSLEDGEGAIISYKQALNDLENVSDNNNEKKQLRSEINHELGGEHASLWQGEELGRKGELPERLRDDCPKAITYFGNSLKILGVRTTDSFSDIMSGLSVLPEEKQLFGCRVLIRMEMVKEMIAAEESDSEDKSAIYEATIANLGTLKDTINETRKKATQNGEQPFMPQEAIDALVRDINLNIGRLRLWNKEYDEAGEIFEKVIQDKDRLLDPEKGKDLFSVLPANPKADDIEKGAAEILKTVPDENNLAAIICLGESWKWRKENRDKDLAESLLGLAVSETVLSSEKLPIISYCPLYLQEEVKHALLKGVGEMKLVVAGSSNPGITDYHIGLESIPLPFELAGCAGYGSGEMDYVRTYDRYGNAVHSRDPYHYYYLEIGKYDGDRDRRFLTGGARFFSDPQNVSIQEYKLHGSFDLDLPAKYKLFGSKSPVKFFVEGIFSMAHIDDKDCFFNTIGRGNETSDPMNWMYQIGIQPYANKWFESAVTFIDQYYGYNDQYVGFNYPSLDKPELKSIGLQAKFVDEKFIGGPLTVTGGLSVPLKDTFPFLTDDLFESSASCELKYEHKYFDAALSVSNYVTGLQTKTTTVGFKAGFNESLLSLFLKPRKKSAIKASPAGSPQDQPKKDAGSAPVPKPVEVNINQLEPGKFEVKQAELPKKDDIFKAEEKIEIKLPTAYNNVRIAEEAEQPAQTSGKGVPAQKKAAPAGNDVGLKRSLFSLLKGPDPITVAENLDEKARASRAADQLMALLNKPILI